MVSHSLSRILLEGKGIFSSSCQPLHHSWIVWRFSVRKGSRIDVLPEPRFIPGGALRWFFYVTAHATSRPEKDCCLRMAMGSCSDNNEGFFWVQTEVIFSQGWDACGTQASCQAVSLLVRSPPPASPVLLLSVLRELSLPLLYPGPKMRLPL